MKTSRLPFAIAVLTVLAWAAPASAHHSFAATYHVDQTKTISGTIVDFMFRNPHSYVHVMAPDKSGKMQRWALEWSAGAHLMDQNVNASTLKVGDKVIATGNPARNEADYRLRLNKLVRPSDGWTWAGIVE